MKLAITSALTINDIIYIGTTKLRSTKIKGEKQSLNTKKSTQKDRLLNSAFSLEYGYNNLWVTFGAYSTSFNPYPLNKRGISRLRNTEWDNISYDSIQRAIDSEVYELNKISINPLDPNHVFVSSFHSGLLDVEIEESIDAYRPIQ